MTTFSAYVMFGFGMLIGVGGFITLPSSPGLGIVLIIVAVLMLARSNSLWSQRKKDRQHRELVEAIKEGKSEK